MGIGNKPCLDIKPSADNIQDRFINIAVGNRGGKIQSNPFVVHHHHHWHSGAGASSASVGSPPGASCSKLTTLLVNVSLKFQM